MASSWTWGALLGSLNAGLVLALVGTTRLREDDLRWLVVPLAVVWLGGMLAAAWCVDGAELVAPSARERARLLLRGAGAGAVLGALVAASIALWPLAMLIGALVGAVAGVALGAVDLAVVAAWHRLVARRRAA